MCIIIYQPPGKTIPKMHFENSYSHNKDGCGIIAADGKHLYRYRQLNGWDKMYQIYLGLKEKFDFPIIIHFRTKSKGEVSIKNCHPFYVNNNLGFAHNGTINDLDLGVNDTRSDTYFFNEMVLKKLPANFLENNAYKLLLSDFIGFSKIAFMDSAKNVTILNEKSGHWECGIWYSNLDYSYEYYQHVANNYPSSRSSVYDMSPRERAELCEKWAVDYHKTVSVWKNGQKVCVYCNNPMYVDESIERGCCAFCDSVFSRMVREGEENNGIEEYVKEIART